MLPFKITRMNRSRTISASFDLRWCAAALAAVLALGAARLAADANSADPVRYLNDVKELASPIMEGRGAGTKGIQLAANMIEERYRSLGIKPAGTNGYFQPFTVITGAQLKEGNRLEVADGTKKQALKLNEDFVPFSFSSSEEVGRPGGVCRIWRDRA